jgi:hypothetical protein
LRVTVDVRDGSREGGPIGEEGGEGRRGVGLAPDGELLRTERAKINAFPLFGVEGLAKETLIFFKRRLAGGGAPVRLVAIGEELLEAVGVKTGECGGEGGHGSRETGSWGRRRGRFGGNSLRE